MKKLEEYKKNELLDCYVKKPKEINYQDLKEIYSKIINQEDKSRESDFFFLNFQFEKEKEKEEEKKYFYEKIKNLDKEMLSL